MPRIAVVAAAAIIAIVGIFVAAASTYYLFDSRETARGVPVVVASRDIAAGTKISAEMVEVAFVPEAEAEPIAIIPSSELAMCHMARVPIAQGERITYAKLQGYDCD